MWPPSQSGRRKGRLVASRRRRRQLNLAGDQFLEERVLLSAADLSSLLVSPQFTHLVQPLPVNLPPVALPVLPSVNSSGSPLGGLTFTPQTAGGGDYLGIIDTKTTVNGGFAAGNATSSNYFEFLTVANGTPNYGVTLNYGNDGLLYLYLLNAQGDLISSSTTNTNEYEQSLPLTGLAPGTYQLQVYAYGVGSLGDPYSLTVVPPAFVPADAWESPMRNDYPQTASNLAS